MTTAQTSAPIATVHDSRFLSSPYNYRFIVHPDTDNPGRFTATTFEMPNLDANAPTSADALNNLAQYLAEDLPAHMRPHATRSYYPTPQERGRFLPVTRRYLHEECREIPGFDSIPHTQPMDGWLKIDLDDDEKLLPELEHAIDALDAALWLEPRQGPDQLTQIYIAVYGHSNIPVQERRWHPQHVESAAGAEPGQPRELHPEEDGCFTRVIAGTHAKAVCLANPRGTPNLALIKRVIPLNGHDEAEFWQRLKEATRAAAETATPCQDCRNNRAEYRFEDHASKPDQDPESALLCSHCVISWLWEQASHPPTIERISLQQ